MDYEKLMMQAMALIDLHMDMYDNLVKEAKEEKDERNVRRYANKYRAVRDLKVGIDKLALQMKNGE